MLELSTTTKGIFQIKRLHNEFFEFRYSRGDDVTFFNMSELSHKSFFRNSLNDLRGRGINFTKKNIDKLLFFVGC